MKQILAILALYALIQIGLRGLSAQAAVPPTLRYEGRIAVAGAPFQGVGQFKFALVDPGVNVSRTATAQATVTSGLVTGITVTDGGAGYAGAPAVRILGRTGSGAVASATQESGTVVSIQVVNAG